MYHASHDRAKREDKSLSTEIEERLRELEEKVEADEGIISSLLLCIEVIMHKDWLDGGGLTEALRKVVEVMKEEGEQEKVAEFLSHLLERHLWFGQKYKEIRKAQ